MLDLSYLIFRGRASHSGIVYCTKPSSSQYQFPTLAPLKVHFAVWCGRILFGGYLWGSGGLGTGRKVCLKTALVETPRKGPAAEFCTRHPPPWLPRPEGPTPQTTPRVRLVIQSAAVWNSHLIGNEIILACACFLLICHIKQKFYLDGNLFPKSCFLLKLKIYDVFDGYNNAYNSDSKR